jgi:branched-chain amino acid transport system ATP-binding protein
LIAQNVSSTTPLPPPQRPTAALLQVSGVSAHFGGVQALNDVSLSVAPEEILALIGPNGAGKTTLFNCISRLYNVTHGTIRFGDIDITRLPRHSIIGLGIARTFQNLGLVPSLTVLDNVLLGAHHAVRPSFWRSLLPHSPERRADSKARVQALEIIHWLGLTDALDRRIGELPFGTLKRVELARALVSEPKLLMLDEPASGLTHAEVDSLAEMIMKIRTRFRMAILLVEHHMQMVLNISDRIAVMQFGNNIAEGTSREIQNNPRVIEAYLGTSP